MFYHVRITTKSSKSSRDEVKLDLTLSQLEERILLPYRAGRAITIGGKSIKSDDITRVRINKTDEDSSRLRPRARQKQNRRLESGIVAIPGIPIEWDIADMGENVTDEFITGPPGEDQEAAPDSRGEARPAENAREVFVVHGRNESARRALFTFLRVIGLQPLEWPKAVKATGKTAPYISEVLNIVFSKPRAIVVLLTPDDIAQLKYPLQNSDDPSYETELTGQARQNVLFEAGMAMAGNQDRTIFVELGYVRPFSDIAGIHRIPLDNGSECRQELAQRLQAAGCPVDLDGTDWHTAGDFGAALKSVEASPGPAGRSQQQPSAVPTDQLSDEARKLLLAAAEDERDALILVNTTGGGFVLQTKVRRFNEEGGSRSTAKWQRAIRELVSQGLISRGTGRGESYRITDGGFQLADSLRSTA